MTLRIGTSEKLLLKYIAKKVDATHANRVSLEELVADLHKVERTADAYIYGFVDSQKKNLGTEALWRDLRYLEASNAITIDRSNPHVSLSPYGKFVSMFYTVNETLGEAFSELGAPTG